ncbi:MAG: citrate synthase/methylcitrate synthase [Glaciihabitans sp.]|nr:citrate synthase/methylcitrate synthase [Glaciihabitans sp.]
MAPQGTVSADIHRGLAGVVVDTTAISKVNPETNSLLYRGYPVQELAAGCTFEEVAYLLWYGQLPNEEQLAQFEDRERGQRGLDDSVARLVTERPATAHPMDIVRTAVSVLGADDPNAADSSDAATLATAQRLFAKLPAIIALVQRHRRGLPAIEPRDDLGYSANFLWMTFGELPAPAVVNAFDASMILYAEHSFNASTFTARVITSTLSDLYSAVVGGIGALKGPLHGGANEAVMHVFDAINTSHEPDAAVRARQWLERELAEHHTIMGFGHRVYKNGDSRVPTMKAALDSLISHYGRPDIAELYDALESEMVSRKHIMPNLDYPSGPAYHLIGFDTDMFTPLFVASRITGWSAHVREQLASNMLIRPLSLYVGEEERHLPR